MGALLNRRDFVRDGLLAIAALRMPWAFAAESGDSEIEQTLAQEILSLYEKVNPVDPKTRRRKFIALGFLSDLHKCKRIDGDDRAEDPVQDYRYWGTLTDCEPSLRLLGAVAGVATLDGVIFAGDFSTANTTVPFAPGDYLAEIRNVRKLYDRYLPSTPFFAVDGNHDRDYWNAKKKAGNRMNEAEWAEALKAANTDVSKNPEIDLTMHRDLKDVSLGEGKGDAYVGNSYTIDFKRLLKTGGKNVRLVMISLYDKCRGADPVLRARDGLKFSGSDVSPSNTVVGFVSHDMKNSLVPVAKEHLVANRGAGYFGMITGHKHFAFTNPSGNGLKSSKIGVTNCYCPRGDKTREACRFALFVFDTDAGKMHEIRLAGGNKKHNKPNKPQLITHLIDGLSNPRENR